VIFHDYRQGVITAIKSVHWSFLFSAAISCGAAGSHAYAQHAAGESVQMRAGFISQVTGAVDTADTYDEQDEYAGYCT
jgi:hypothetical protein